MARVWASASHPAAPVSNLSTSLFQGFLEQTGCVNPSNQSRDRHRSEISGVILLKWPNTLFSLSTLQQGNKGLIEGGNPNGFFELNHPIDDYYDTLAER